MADRPHLTFIGTLPPPFTGMTISSSNVVSYLRPHVDLRLFNTSSRLNRGVAWKLMRFVHYTRAALWLLLARRRKHECLYLVANSGFGLWYDLGLVMIARLRGYRVLMHHQVYSYIWKYYCRMALIHRFMGPRGVHVCLGYDMIDRFKGMYDASAAAIRVPNNLLADDAWKTVAEQKTPASSVRLGHISNLSIAKGLGRVIATFRRLREKDVDVRLTLAGGCETWRERELVADAAKEFGDRFEHLGPVYDEDKWAFFRDMDVMLFPTAYHNEAQPVVVIESMGCGAPVVTFDRACISEMIGPDGEGGVCIDMDDDYVARAAAIVIGWVNDREALKRAQDRAAVRGREFQEMTEQRMAALVEWLSGRP